MADSTGLSYEELKRVDQQCDEFEKRLAEGIKPTIERFLLKEPQLRVREYLLAQLISMEVEHLGDGFTHQSYRSYCEQLPGYRPVVDSVFLSELTYLIEDMQKTIISGSHQDPGLRLAPGSMLGKYRILNCVGKGSFGIVYHASDTELDRDVALKVSRSVDANENHVQERFIEEAKTAAKINTDGIATIFDLFENKDRVCIVQEYIDGYSLGQVLASRPLSIEQSVNLIIDIASAIDWAHKNKIYHRDLKPGNIIIDQYGKPTLVDFGLAFRADSENRIGVFGTPSYMSPEQVRGETNQTDSTTDIWAIGVVLYEMLAGVRPFEAKHRENLYEAIVNHPAEPLDKVNSSVAAELNRITLKCISKKQSERYQNVKLLVEDLTRYLNHEKTAKIEPKNCRLVPKGLRPFSADDKPFYLSLLPGPRDHRGVPESVAFWADRIEDRRGEDGFSVGLIYGVSGCGKTSFVRAGVLPQLSEDVKTVYVSANHADTELKIFGKLRTLLPQVPIVSLPDTFAAVRDGDYLRRGEKLLVVIDQFEQWLSCNSGNVDSQLGSALRHSDGEKVQILLLVSQEYWPAAVTFLEQNGVPVVQNQNCRAVESFDRQHAKNLLFQFAQAHQRCSGDTPNAQQEIFLDRVVNDLAKNDRVTGIQLAMFAEAFKEKEWALDSLKRFGGAKGVGVGFLNETFVLPTAAPAYRVHMRAAKRCMGALLPDTGSGLNGHVKTRAELLAVSGYAEHPKKFQRLLDLLENDLKLIAATEPVTRSANTSSLVATNSVEDETCFQLSSSHLVPITRRWIEMEDRRHVRGRVEARMTEVAGVWGESQNSRYLPTFWESISILIFSRWKNWDALRRKMMFASAKKHAGTMIFGVAVLTLAIAACLQVIWQRKLDNRVQQIKTTLISDLEEQVMDVEAWKDGLIPKLQQEQGRLGSIEPRSQEHGQTITNQNLKLSVALAMLNDSNWEDVVKGFDFVPTDQVTWLADFVGEKQSSLKEQFEASLEAEFDPNDESQFRRSMALAQWGHPRFLAEFLTYRDSREAREFLEILQNGSPQKAIECFREIVAELKSSVFENTSQKLIALTERYDGCINREAGLALAVPIDEVNELLRNLHKEGYAPLSVRPYYKNDDELVAMTFRRGLKFKSSEFDDCVIFEQFNKAVDISQKQKKLAQQGWTIVDIASCSEPLRKIKTRFSAVWLRNESSKHVTLKTDIPHSALAETITEQTEKGFQIERMFCIEDDANNPVYSAIWSRANQGPKDAVEFLATPKTDYLANFTNQMLGASIADIQLAAVSITKRDFFQLNIEKRNLEQGMRNLHDLPLVVPSNGASKVNRYGIALAHLGFDHDAERFFKAICAQAPGWLDRNLEYVKFLSRRPDRDAFIAECERVEKLSLDAGQQEIRLPMANLRSLVTLGKSKKAKAAYDEFLTCLDELEAKYSNKPDALRYINISKIRASLVYVQSFEAADPQHERILDESAQKLFNSKRTSVVYLMCDPDFDVLRKHPLYQKYVYEKKYGTRTTTCWRFDSGVETDLKGGASPAQLLAESRVSLAAGYLPKTAACQTTIDEPYGLIVSEKLLKSPSTLNRKKRRLVRTAVFMDILGDKSLLNQIKTGIFGQDVQFLLDELAYQVPSS